MAKHNGVLNWAMIAVVATLMIALIASVAGVSREATTNTAGRIATDKRADEHAQQLSVHRATIGDMRADVAEIKANVKILVDKL